jgi:hypothetical protein
MPEDANSIQPEIVKLIERTVRESMQSFGLKSVDVRAGEDHDGGPVIFVDAYYDLSETPVDTMVIADLISTLRERIWNSGERRFPHIRHKFHERQEVRSRRRARA